MYHIEDVCLSGMSASCHNGDLVTDGVARVWTREKQHHAPVEELQAYQSLIVDRKSAAKTVGGVKVDDLPGREALAQPGTKDGQTRIVREGDIGVAYSWSREHYTWEKVGEVVDGPNSNESRSLHGVAYDYVFDVDIGDGLPTRKLPFNRGHVNIAEVDKETVRWLPSGLEEAIEALKRNKVLCDLGAPLVAAIVAVRTVSLSSQRFLRYAAPPHEEFFNAKAQARDSFRSSIRILSTFHSIRSSKSRQQASISDNLESSRTHYVERTRMHLASDEPPLPLRLRRRNMLLSCLIPLSLTKPTNALADQIVEDTSNKIRADNGIHGDGFGFDGLGTSEDDYAAGKVVALAQAGDGAVLFLGVDGFDLPLRMVVGVAEAMAILTAAQERRSRRPVTHEAWGSSLAAVGWKVDRVTITNMESDVFYSRLVLSLDPTRMASSSTAGDASTSSPISDHLQSVDMRPSDGIALALRCRAPLYISKKVAEEIVGALKKGSESGKGQPNPLERPGLQANRDSPVVDSLSQFVAQYKSGSMAFIVDDEVYKKSLRLPGKD